MDFPELSALDLESLSGYIPAISWITRHYLRGEVHGLDLVPTDRPVLFVANHSGGTMTPDSVLFILAFIERFGIERPLYWMGHDALMGLPVLGDFLRRCGVLPASQKAARMALESGACVVAYPGGENELHRPWRARNEIRFFGRTGFVEVARAAGALIMPVVAHGAHNTYFPITDGRRLARRLGLDRRYNLKALPVSLALPWGLNIGDYLGHIPLPAKVRITVLPPIDVDDYGDDLGAAYAYVTGQMQTALNAMAGDR